MLAAPRVVLGTRDAEGRFHPTPQEKPRPVISSDTARTLAGMLEGVVARGTGKGAAVPGYRIAGKTGTAQVALKQGGYSKDHYVASFGGFGPVRSPRIAGMVVLGSPRGKAHSGGEVAAPVFGRIMAESLAYLRVPPDEDPLAALARPDSGAARSTRGRVGEATSPQDVVAGGRKKERT
jgi:stage V sporulation protein D (sporulation-specific penicillin-binding protein)